MAAKNESTPRAEKSFKTSFLDDPLAITSYQRLMAAKNESTPRAEKSFKNTKYLEIALVGVEYEGFFAVIAPHQFHGDATDGRLEVGLLRVDHDTDFFRNGMLKMKKRKFCDSKAVRSVGTFTLLSDHSLREVRHQVRLRMARDKSVSGF